MSIRVIAIVFTFLFSNPALSGNSFHDEKCEAISWKSERISNNRVSVQGFISEPKKSVSVEVWRHDKLIGDTITYSNHRGAFQVNVYTNRKAYKRPQVVITCD